MIDDGNHKKLCAEDDAERCLTVMGNIKVFILSTPVRHTMPQEDDVMTSGIGA